MNDQPEHVNTITPQPSPQTFNIGRAAMSDGSQMVILAFQGFDGQWVVHLSPEGARELARQLTEAATGIAIAPAGVVLPPPPHPNGNGHGA